MEKTTTTDVNFSITCYGIFLSSVVRCLKMWRAWWGGLLKDKLSPEQNISWSWFTDQRSLWFLPWSTLLENSTLCNHLWLTENWAVGRVHWNVCTMWNWVHLLRTMEQCRWSNVKAKCSVLSRGQTDAYKSTSLVSGKHWITIQQSTFGVCWKGGLGFLNVQPTNLPETHDANQSAMTKLYEEPSWFYAVN